jgi:hypothetical protein
MTGTETQDHPIEDGTSLQISRNGNHQYWLGDAKTKGGRVPGVTGIVEPLGPGFGAGKGWAQKLIRASGGDLDAPDVAGKAALDEGNALHDAIDAYVTHGTVSENPLFLAWFDGMAGAGWLASETFVLSQEHGYGGTADAFYVNPNNGHHCIWDWKTVDRDSWAKHGSRLRMDKDSAQLAAYAHALHEMGSVYDPTDAWIGYVLRDGSDVIVERVDLERGWRLFTACLALHQAIHA